MSYIETAARFNKMQENGAVKKVTEKFLVDALSFTEAEARTIKELQPYINEDFEVSATKKTKITEILGDKQADRFYLAKVAFIIIDEKTAKEKRTVSQWLIGGADFNDAYETLLREISKSMADIEIAGLVESPIVGYIPYRL